MKALLVEHGKGNQAQTTQEVRKTEADNILIYSMIYKGK